MGDSVVFRVSIPIDLEDFPNVQELLIRMPENMGLNSPGECIFSGERR